MDRARESGVGIRLEIRSSDLGSGKEIKVRLWFRFKCNGLVSCS